MLDVAFLVVQISTLGPPPVSHGLLFNYPGKKYNMALRCTEHATNSGHKINLIFGHSSSFCVTIPKIKIIKILFEKCMFPTLPRTLFKKIWFRLK